MDSVLHTRGQVVGTSLSTILSELDPVVTDMPIGLESEIDEALASEIETYPIALADAIRISLSNNSVIRTDADFVAGSSDLLRMPDIVHSADDVAIRQTGYLFGQRGEAAALSDFDTQFDWATNWNRNETVQDNRFLSGGILPGGTLVEESANFQMGLAKNLRSGGRAAIVQSWDYVGTNRQDALYPSAYSGNLAAEVRQPFLAGAGRLFTEVAGPPGEGELARGITGVSQGILIARAETQIAKIDLSLAATQFLADVESVYWQLSVAQESFTKATQALTEVQGTRDIIAARLQAQADSDELDSLAIEELVLRAEQLVNDTRLQRDELNDRLARLLGYSILVKPQFVATDVVKAIPVKPDVDGLTALAIEVRAELDRQRERIRTIDLQIRAAQSLLLPQLDGIARYQINGFGDHLISEPIPGPDEDLQSAYNNLSQNEHTGWRLGFQFTHTFGRRLARARLKNLRVQGQKARALLHQQMHEIEREVVFAVRRLETAERDVALARRRTELLAARLDTLEKRYQANDHETDVTTIAEVSLSSIQAQIQLDVATGRYAESLVRLQQSIGRTLPENGVSVF